MANRIYVTGAYKDGATIVLNIQDKPAPVVLNLRDNTIRSYTGRNVQKIPVSCAPSPELSETEILIYRACRQGLCTAHFLEPYLSYPDLLPRIPSYKDIPNECPAGFIKWLRANDKPITQHTLHEFRREKALSKLPKQDAEILQLLTSENSPYNDGHTVVKWYENTTPSQRSAFNKIFKVSIKNVSWNLHDEVREYVQIMSQHYVQVPRVGRIVLVDPEKYVDTNRTFAHNIQQIRDNAKVDRNEAILANENRIRSIENLSNDEFTIIVPRTLQEFSNEGVQQHNCVGHYYHNSMARGEAFIYFIRHAETPTKSYITNRYCPCSNKTVETRIANNRCNNDKNALALIGEIDKMITELLAE